ncbi:MULTISPECIES: TetR/AcrR family transcriptional regulator [Proteus]|uniref:TetR family transcriptional regulator n=1 Tax=Proteus terrae subsp. cibarius TaxID=626774 RepID=A0A6G6SU25_9GAMM|nr:MULTISPECIES: TetR/AcrR family transcriptional regulator [Proteus]QHP75467.1 TetR/AcrR family transcriptional regulator [Proteus vulgaris]MBG2913527.1 TetR/AcrR family transcriptional regulator [Proteus terrae subsp. cibarius]MBG3089200.1 TetR/AcrR family transcriptional regulator [Proteus terrae subsp. cibarius]MCM2367687.1 TetR/AcrR family transcriptional regulator [Proteus sp. FZP2095]MCO4180883.1 TetR/AcrR family transcriptional regulator [Proteus terrae]
MSYSDETDAMSGTRKRTHQLLVTTALGLFEQGMLPTVSELAAHAGVSRATAYRYFPTQSDLISATVDASLAPIIAWRPTPEDNTQQRITELLNLAYPQMFKHEGALRGALQVSLQQWAKERQSSEYAEKRFIRGHRKDILLKVIEPLKSRYPEEMWDKVIKSFSLIYGSEVFLVMKDIWKMDDQQVIDMTQWMAKAILNQAKSDYPADND